MRTKVQQVYTPLLYYAQLINDKSSLMDTMCFETSTAMSYTVHIRRKIALTFSLAAWFWFRKGVINSILKFIS